MKRYIGIRFSRYGQVRVGAYECSADKSFAFGQAVVVQTESSLFFGRVVWQCEKTLSCYTKKNQEENNSVEKTKADGFEPFDISQVQTYLDVRAANSEELLSADHNSLLSQEAFHFCKRCIKNRELDMKLIDVEVLFDKTKMIFYFTAPTRIDFRELVKDLVREYRTRIELRQIGVRHEAQMLGTLGNCGMVVCCRRFLKEFAPVTIKMAKEQNLFLNPAKISGMCGRLLCCLSYEQESYDYFHRNSPKLGKRYKTDRGVMRVIRSNMFKNSVHVLNEDGQEVEMNLDDWKLLRPKREESNDNTAFTQNSPFDYMGINPEDYGSDTELSHLLDDHSDYDMNKSQNDKNAHGDNQKKKTRPNYRPKAKAQKRASFDTDIKN